MSCEEISTAYMITDMTADESKSRYVESVHNRMSRIVNIPLAMPNEFMLMLDDIITLAAFLRFQDFRLK